MALLHIILLIKNSLQQQIHFNGNIFGNKCCRYNRVSCSSIIAAVWIILRIRTNIIILVIYWYTALIWRLFLHEDMCIYICII